ncbi:hypothetical protein GWR56_18610 [Mucilaginibacter sp. 14171R-50]|uniref:DUF5655 domain-containing protein n=1 Tax=Mucilaginibacter sp. 14171R-50 TaxID=2703789 RepID=UPI00138C2679|nr:DUF5655 domain-containing protein [Mucilaginibacter sp. 14171R-50]QHS57458.1 hypothetical protein GWR56_18610 [Mucilaginibacter sp. 14171R-50]
MTILVQNKKVVTPSEEIQLSQFLTGKSEHTLMLFDHFVAQFKTVGDITVHPAKTMIGIANDHKRIAWVTQLGKNFIHVVFPFKQEYPDNLCFQKIAQVPGQQQFNHHFRMLNLDDVNEEVLGFMKLAYREE